MKTAYQETRVQLALRIAREARGDRQLNVKAFADDFVALAHKLVPAAFSASKLRLPHPTDGDQMEADERHNRQIVERWIKGAVQKFDPEFEEPWVLALPEVYRERALGELAARYGLLAARHHNTTDGLASFSHVLEDAASLTASMSPILADGRIDEKDRPYIKPALENCAKLQGSLASVQQQLTAQLRDELPGNVAVLGRAG